MKNIVFYLFFFSSFILNAQNPVFYSQYGQDKFVYETFFKGEKQGIFVDIGAYDGITFSNSYFFEKELGWSGICVEPIPKFFKKLSQLRECHCIRGCISNENKKASFVHVAATENTPENYHLDMLSGLQDTYDPQHIARIQQEVQDYHGKTEVLAINCFTLERLLAEKGIDHINYLSIDTEGNELEILQSIDFAKIAIDVLTVEDNYGGSGLVSFMEKRGFTPVQRLGCDIVFARKDFLAKKKEQHAYRAYDVLIDPRELLTPNRFDLMAKYIYVQFQDLALRSNWGKEIYLNHLQSWCNFFSDLPPTNIPNYKCADPYERKTKPEEWITSFNKVISSIQRDGFRGDVSVVSYNKNTKILLDGGHRVATSLYYNRPIPCRVFERGGEPVHAQQLLHNGMPRKYCDAMAYQYAKLKDTTFVVCLFPVAQGHLQEVVDRMNAYGEIVYHKDVFLNQNGAKNLVKIFYEGEPWIGDRSSNYAGANVKVAYSFPPESTQFPMHVFLFECSSLDKVQAAKKGIRDLFKMGNHSVHINDTHAETIRLAQTLFNENSIHFINNSEEKGFLRFESLMGVLTKKIEETGCDPEYLCIDSSSVLAAYGLRDCNDLDILHYQPLPKEISSQYLIDSHNDEARYHLTTIDDLIFNPENHFYYRGVKFVSLDRLAQMKAKRNEPKDRKDIQLISKVKKK